MLNDPKTVLATTLQIQIPEHIRFTVVENTQTLRYLVLPHPMIEEEAMDEGLADLNFALQAGGLSSTPVSCFGGNMERRRSAMLRC